MAAIEVTKEWYRGKGKNGEGWVNGPYFVKNKDEKNEQHYIIRAVTPPVDNKAINDLLNIPEEERKENEIKVVATVVEVMPESVGQSTEVNDYLGNLVFEDDVVYVEEGTKHYLAKIQYDERRGTFVGERVDGTTFDLENISFSVIPKNMIERIVTYKLYPNDENSNELILDFLDVYDKFITSIADAATALKSANYDLITTTTYTTLKDIQFELASIKLLKEAIV